MTVGLNFVDFNTGELLSKGNPLRTGRKPNISDNSLRSHKLMMRHPGLPASLVYIYSVDAAWCRSDRAVDLISTMPTTLATPLTLGCLVLGTALALLSNEQPPGTNPSTILAYLQLEVFTITIQNKVLTLNK